MSSSDEEGFILLTRKFQFYEYFSKLNLYTGSARITYFSTSMEIESS